MFFTITQYEIQDCQPMSIITNLTEAPLVVLSVKLESLLWGLIFRSTHLVLAIIVFFSSQ